MKNKLTIIIPFLNEGIEIERTVRSIRMTAGEDIKILLINDNSTDRFNYEKIAIKYSTEYYVNDHRIGVAASRDLGVSLCDTDFFLLLDGHMRFYEKNWHKKLIRLLEVNKQNILCCQCQSLDEFGRKNRDRNAYGAMICMNEPIHNRQLFDTIWITKDPEPDKIHIKIPCILGAAYACSKEYWQKLNGLDGLINFGADEQYISLKVWLNGGNCILLKDIIVGHIFRNQTNIAPYNIPLIDILYNKLLIIDTLFPNSLKNNMHLKFKELYPYDYACALFKIQLNQEITGLRDKYFKSLIARSISSFIDFNNSYLALTTPIQGNM